MKRILGTVMVTAALTAPGLAADLGARTYTKAPVVAPVSNWSGFYVGGNLGYGWGDGNTDFSFLPSPERFGDNNTTLGARSTGCGGDPSRPRSRPRRNRYGISLELLKRTPAQRIAGPCQNNPSLIPAPP